MEWAYHGSTITVVERNGRFVVDNEPGTFDTFQGAKEAVDEARRVEVRQHQDNLALPALGDDGKPYTIRGINRTSASLLGIPDRVTVYYPSEACEALLAERAVLNDRMAQINTALAPLEIPFNYGYGRVDVNEYAERVARLRKAYTVAEEGAAGLTDSAIANP